MPQNDLRKAAVLIASLDAKSADKLLDQMSDRQAAAIRNAIMELEDVSLSESDSVIAEFIHGDNQDQATVDLIADGIEIDPSLAKAINGRSMPPTYSPPREAPPFRFLHEAAGDLLSDYLRHEHPQTVALVLAHLPPEQASAVIVQLDAPMQAEVLQRVADLGETDREVIHEVERILESHVSRHLQVVERRTAGMATVHAIINAANSPQRGHVLENLVEHQQRLAQSLQGETSQAAQQDAAPAPIRTSPSRENSQSSAGRRSEPPDNHDSGREATQPRRPSLTSAGKSPPSQPVSDKDIEPAPFDFEQLAFLDVNSLAKVMQNVDNNLILIALVGASAKLTNKIMRQLPSQESKMLKRRIEQQGPLRLRDVELAQAAIAKAAGRLVAAGTITAPTVERFAMTA